MSEIHKVPGDWTVELTLLPYGMCDITLRDKEGVYKGSRYTSSGSILVGSVENIKHNLLLHAEAIRNQ